MEVPDRYMPYIRRALKSELHNTQDKLRKKQIIFSSLSDFQMEEYHGSSGQTPRDIISEYEMQEEELINVIEELSP